MSLDKPPWDVKNKEDDEKQRRGGTHEDERRKKKDHSARLVLVLPTKPYRRRSQSIIHPKLGKHSQLCYFYFTHWFFLGRIIQPFTSSILQSSSYPLPTAVTLKEVMNEDQ